MALEIRIDFSKLNFYFYFKISKPFKEQNKIFTYTKSLYPIAIS